MSESQLEYTHGVKAQTGDFTADTGDVVATAGNVKLTSGAITGTAPDSQLVIPLATQQPTALTVDTVLIGAKDSAASKATLAIWADELVAAETDETKLSHVLSVWINGVAYRIMLIAV
jgi:hypothetical protein